MLLCLYCESLNHQNSTAIKKPSKEILRKAIIDGYGNISTIASSLKVDRNTVYKWIEEEDLEEARKEGRNSRIDWVESALDKKIKAEDTTAIIFFLKTQGKERGYIERQEIQHEGEAKITINKTYKNGNSDNNNS